MNRRHAILAGGVLIAAWLAFLSDKTPQSSVVEPVMRSATINARATTVRTVSDRRLANASASEPIILAIVPRDLLIDGAHADISTGSLFAMHSWTPTPPPPPPPKPVAPPPPIAPPLPYAYLGKKSEDGKWEVYLARGEQTVIAREQGVIDGMYRIDAIAPPTLTLTYLPLNQAQTLTIGGTD